MVNDYAWSFTVVTETCLGSYTHIHDIQTSGSASPPSGSLVVEGVVTGDFQAANGLDGFFLQSLAQDDDGQPLTSEGIFVYATTPDVSVGDRIQLEASVQEYHNLTELTDVTNLIICSSGNIIEPTPVSLPIPIGATLEQYEGMLVRFTNELTVAQNYFQGRFGQLTVAAGGRVYQPNNGQLVSSAGENASRTFVLDDGSSAQYPSPIPYIGEENTLRAGDTIASGLTGLLDQGLIAADNTTTGYRLQPRASSEVHITRANQRTTAPDLTGGAVPSPASISTIILRPWGIAVLKTRQNWTARPPSWWRL